VQTNYKEFMENCHASLILSKNAPLSDINTASIAKIARTSRDLCSRYRRWDQRVWQYPEDRGDGAPTFGERNLK
jgi:hypothetical protein